MRDAEKIATTYGLEGKSVWIAGGRGMLGAALARRLAGEDCEIIATGREDLDLTSQAAVNAWVDDRRPDVAIISAAKVGGIAANAALPVDFLVDNALIAINTLSACHRARVEKVLYVGSAAVFPKFANQPVDETAILTGAIEPAHEPYALAKLTGLKLCAAYQKQFGARFISANPNNLYGPGDNFDLATSHVVPALIRKAHDAVASGAPRIEIWGSGKARREFLHIDDCADALVHLLKHYEDSLPINIGTGRDHTIDELVEIITRTVGYKGEITRDTARPDGPPRRLLDTTRLRALGWIPGITLEEGLRTTYAWYRTHLAGRHS